MAVSFPEAENGKQNDGDQLAECREHLQVARLLDADAVDKQNKRHHGQADDGKVVVRDSEQEAENGAEIAGQRADRRRPEDEGQHPAVEIGDFGTVDFFQVNIDAARAGIQDPQLAKREPSGHAEHRSDHPGGQRPGGIARRGHDRWRFHESAGAQHHPDHDGESAHQSNIFFQFGRPVRFIIRHGILPGGPPSARIALYDSPSLSSRIRRQRLYGLLPAISRTVRAIWPLTCSSARLCAATSSG
ncbi:MAG: hypothetical protein BWX45_00588 [Deltaproteobacteria bacterium ADurb.Bin002]|nr:MAG: hypothetical protein BWX45_00588 [Deltaproteobacteria bacterium ADurb.Bin002]